MSASALSPVLQAVATALRGDAVARRIGRFDALAGKPWCCPPDADLLGYSLGYADGVTDRCCGACGLPPPTQEDA